MSLLEPFDEKSARQRASFLVLLSDRLECDEFIVQLGEYIGNAPKLVQKVFLFFFFIQRCMQNWTRLNTPSIFWQ